MYKSHFNKNVFSEKMGGDIDSICSVLQFSVNNIKQKCMEIKNFKQKTQVYRFAHFLRGTANNINFDLCVEKCEEIMTLTDLSISQDQTITDEMKEKLKELEEIVKVSINIVDIYLSSKSG